MKSRYAPVIIIGMHRSGTTMITQLLESLGLFVGKRKDDNYEAIFFHKLNEWFMSQANASWDRPNAIQDLLGNKKIRNLTTEYVSDYLIESPRTISFLGLNKYLRHRTPINLDIPWGWKSPLNTYTLPLWLDLFPDASVVHVYRHGVDVAESLRARGRRDMQRTKLQELYYQLKFLHYLRPKPGKFVDSLRCYSLEGALALWEEYLSEARGHVRCLGPRAIELRYEDFLYEPIQALREVGRFCGLGSNKTGIEQVAKRVKRERAYAYKNNTELQAFADRVTERLVAQGY